MAKSANSTNLSEIDRRGFVKCLAVVAGVFAVPTMAAASPYTIDDYLTDLNAAGVRVLIDDGVVYYETINADWQGFETARIRFNEAGLTGQQVKDRFNTN